ncbi:hypothetical protein IFM89_006954 [Coptis chinensis]|uniref:Uncharacterized protein n=1 Tax=Coptis chinensis TaxID=261450 RepID=A0A835HD21_9MAGN|nr:hypothetical protein IFM89_006954 [Coptis chinensis]
MDPMLYEVEKTGYTEGVALEKKWSICMDPMLNEVDETGYKEGLAHKVMEENTDVLQQVTTNKETSIHIAARYGHYELINFILIRYPILLRALLSIANLVGDTPLHIAARAGHLHILNLLIGCAKNSQSSSWRDIETGRAEATEIMRKQNRKKDTIMHEVARNCHLEIVFLLIKEDRELLCITNDVGESPLHVAVEAGKLDVIDEMLKAGHCCYKGPNGRTALHAAVIHKRPDIAKKLLEKRRELVEEADDNRRTPLHFASAFGFLDSVKMLLDQDISTSYLLDKSGSPPIHISAQYGHLNIIKEFLKRQPQLKYLLNGRGQNILHIASKSQQWNVVKYILNEEGFDGGLSNGQDKDGNTPLHEAVITGDPYIVRILAVRVDLMSLNNKRLSAVDIARSQYKERTGGKKSARAVRVPALKYGPLIRKGAAILLVLLQLLNNKLLTSLVLRFSQLLTAAALCSMLQAFMAGVNVTLDNEKQLISMISSFGYTSYIFVFFLLLGAPLCTMNSRLEVKVCVCSFSWLSGLNLLSAENDVSILFRYDK